MWLIWLLVKKFVLNYYLFCVLCKIGVVFVFQWGLRHLILQDVTYEHTNINTISKSTTPYIRFSFFDQSFSYSGNCSTAILKLFLEKTFAFISTLQVTQDFRFKTQFDQFKLHALQINEDCVYNNYSKLFPLILSRY